MVSNSLARKNKVRLERVLNSENPSRGDLNQLFGSACAVDGFLSKTSRNNQMYEIAAQLTPSNWDETGARNYAHETSNWQRKYLRKHGNVSKQ
ncbi:MAG: hypothetical protein KC589_04750 [Nanoarchaeota archaeon]|nr:hypothetical protein [Nanoarchaeota archaeon]